MILGMLWLACYNPKKDWRTEEVNMMRCPEECGKQWRLVQRKSGWQKQKKEEREKDRKTKEREAEERENNRSRESSGGVGNLGQGRRKGKIGGRGKEVGSRKIP